MGMIGYLASITDEQLQEFLADPDAVADYVFPEEGDAPNLLDLDKSWQGIHFLLTGDAWSGAGPLAQTVLGGTEFGEDMGYGPNRYLTATQVAETAKALAQVSRDELAGRYSAERFNEAEIYPDGWDDAPETLDYLLDNYEALVEHYHQTAAERKAMLLFLA